MSADKRSVSTDALETLGTIIDETQKRDAIHLAVEPVIAGEGLRPGDHITVDENGIATLTDVNQGLGIVDPFLAAPVKKGQRFWFVMYPRQVKSLRHVWTHPAFPDELLVGRDPEPKQKKKPTSASEDWIRGFAASIKITFEEIMEAAEAYQLHDEYLTHGSRFEGVSVPDEFWVHYSALTGKVVSKTGTFFSCSC